MSGPYTLFCLRCGRPAVQRKIDPMVRRVFYVVTDKCQSVDDVRLCASCERMIDNAVYRIRVVRRNKP